MVDLPWLNDPNYQNYFNAPQPQQGYAQPNNIASLLQALPSINYEMKGLNTGPSAANAAQMGQVAGAQMNPDNPLYKKLYGQYQQQGQQNLAYQMQQLGSQNRKLSSMGRVPLFDPERGGEQLFRGLTQGYQDVGNNANMMTQLALGGAGRTLGSASTANNNLALMQNTSQYQQAKGQTGIAGLLAHLFGL